MAHRGMDINGLIWSELFIGRGIAAAVAEEKPRKARAGAKVTTNEGRRGAMKGRKWEHKLPRKLGGLFGHLKSFWKGLETPDKLLR